jgi:hypothetical protein
LSTNRRSIGINIWIFFVATLPPDAKPLKLGRGDRCSAFSFEILRYLVGDRVGRPRRPGHRFSTLNFQASRGYDPAPLPGGFAFSVLRGFTVPADLSPTGLQRPIRERDTVRGIKRACKPNQNLKLELLKAFYSVDTYNLAGICLFKVTSYFSEEYPNG